MKKLRAIFLEGLTQLGKNWKLLLFLYTPILLLFMLMALVSRSTPGLSMSYFTRDITASGDLPFYAGLLSQLGAILWSATAAVCLFTVFLMRARNQNPSARRFLIQAGILTVVLLVDDVFLLHESVFPEYLHIRERYVYLLYFVLCLGFLLLNLPEILTSEYSILGLSLFMFGLSIFFDGAHLDKYDQHGVFFSENIQTFLEDAPKFVGIVTWLFYFTRYAIQSQVPIAIPAVSLRVGNLSPLGTESFTSATTHDHDSGIGARR